MTIGIVETIVVVQVKLEKKNLFFCLCRLAHAH